MQCFCYHSWPWLTLWLSNLWFMSIYFRTEIAPVATGFVLSHRGKCSVNIKWHVKRRPSNIVLECEKNLEKLNGVEMGISVVGGQATEKIGLVWSESLTKIHFLIHAYRFISYLRYCKGRFWYWSFQSAFANLLDSEEEEKPSFLVNQCSCCGFYVAFHLLAFLPQFWNAVGFVRYWSNPTSSNYFIIFLPDRSRWHENQWHSFVPDHPLWSRNFILWLLCTANLKTLYVRNSRISL